jgi:hypothetical protein
MNKVEWKHLFSRVLWFSSTSYMFSVTAPELCSMPEQSAGYHVLGPKGILCDLHSKEVNINCCIHLRVQNKV